MFTDGSRVGAFAVSAEALARGDDEALFRLLVTTAMFQRRQDVQILRILQRIPETEAHEISTPRRLLQLVDDSGCAHLKSNDELLGRCDLAKDPTTKRGCCAQRPRTSCHLKRHTVTLKRYGHFGKMPTSTALMLREAGADGLNALRRQVLERHADETERAVALEVALSKAWRINNKIACMFLSAITNPDLGGRFACWREGIDWTHFVVVDSNVDAFLGSIGYRGPMTYEARRVFVQRLARAIDLREFDRKLHAYNPRVVQQALYLFMSGANRRSLADDCSHVGATACATCPTALARRCPLRTAQSSSRRAS